MEIISHVSKLTCTLHFKASSSFLKSDSGGHHIEGFIMNERWVRFLGGFGFFWRLNGFSIPVFRGHRLRALYGVWTNFLASIDPHIFERNFPNWGKERKARLASANDAIRRTPSAPPVAGKALSMTTSLDGESSNPSSPFENNDHPENMPVPNPTPTLPVLAESNVLWRVKPRPKGNEQVSGF